MKIGTVGLWAGRATAALLFLFWGAFFVEHTAEWFLRGDGRFPPAWVAVQHGFHFLMLAGLAAMMRWERAGAVVLTVSTFAFFGFIGLRSFPWIALLNLIPLACFGVYWLAGRATSQAVMR
ncbi:MAG TPA: hypothetical protein VGK29_06275 [Paludibaculum sp.]|jgi:hypothetical protein